MNAPLRQPHIAHADPLDELRSTIAEAAALAAMYANHAADLATVRDDPAASYMLASLAECVRQAERANANLNAEKAKLATRRAAA